MRLVLIIFLFLLGISSIFSQTLFKIDNKSKKKYLIEVFYRDSSYKNEIPKGKIDLNIESANIDSIRVYNSKNQILDIKLSKENRVSKVNIIIKNNNSNCYFIADYLTGLSNLFGPRKVGCKCNNEVHIYY